MEIVEDNAVLLNWSKKLQLLIVIIRNSADLNETAHAINVTAESLTHSHRLSDCRIGTTKNN